MNNYYFINALTNISNMYQSMLAFFYQSINQSQYNNNTLATYTIDYTLLLSSSKYLTNLTIAQVNTQIQAYIDECNILITYVTTNQDTQNFYIYESIQNQLNDSIVQLSGFAQNLLKAQYEQILVYTVPYTMSLSNVLYLNNISIDNANLQIKLNPLISDFNNILANTQLNLTRS